MSIHRNAGRRSSIVGIQAALALAFVVGGGTYLGNAAAQQRSQPGVSSSSTTPLFISGGIGLEGRSMLSEHEKNSNLKLVFTEPQGSYLSDINVSVIDRRGNVVFETATAGPWLLARLEPGSYKVVAKDGQGKQERMVTLGHDLRTVHFRMAEQAGIPGRPGS